MPYIAHSTWVTVLVNGNSEFASRTLTRLRLAACASLATFLSSSFARAAS